METAEYTNDLGIENSSARMLPTGTVCLSRGGTVGYVVVLGRPMATSQGFANWICGEHLLPEFLKYLFLREQEALHRFAIGTTIQTIYYPDIKALHVCVPSTAEQQRIVGILDDAFAGIAAARANAERNLRNARELFESELQAVFTRGGNRWAERPLSDVAEFKNGLNFNQSSRGQSVRVVGVGDFHRNYVVPMSELQSVTIDDTLDETYQIREGDLLTVRSNGSKDLVGRCMLVPAVDEVISFSGFVIRIRCDKNVIVPRFLLHFMKSSATRDQLMRDGGGSNISNINQGKLSALRLSVPSLTSQQSIAETLDRLVEETQRLQSVYQRKLAALDALKGSLLHQTFTGQLAENALATV